MKNLKTFNECMKACNEGLGTAKTFAELKEGDKLCIYYNALRSVIYVCTIKEIKTFKGIYFFTCNYTKNGKIENIEVSLNQKDINSSLYQTRAKIYCTEKELLIKTLNEQNLQYNIKDIYESFLPFNKYFSELKEGDKIYMWVNDSSNDDASKEIVNVYTFESMNVPDDRASMDPWSKIKLNTYEGDVSIYNKDYNSNVSFENRNAKTWWCVSTHFSALQQTLRDVFHLNISEENIIQ